MALMAGEKVCQCHWGQKYQLCLYVYRESHTKPNEIKLRNFICICDSVSYSNYVFQVSSTWSYSLGEFQFSIQIKEPYEKTERVSVSIRKIFYGHIKRIVQEAGDDYHFQREVEITTSITSGSVTGLKDREYYWIKDKEDAWDIADFRMKITELRSLSERRKVFKEKHKEKTKVLSLCLKERQRRLRDWMISGKMERKGKTPWRRNERLLSFIDGWLN